MLGRPDGVRLGNWCAVNDSAEWTFQAPVPGRYFAEITYSAGANGGGEFLLEVAGQRIVGRAERTANWEAFREAGLGPIFLPAGKSRISIRATRLDGAALMDVKTIRLTFDSPASRKPIPEEKDRARAMKSVRELFKADFARQAPDDVKAFSRKLLQQGIETQNDAGMKYGSSGKCVRDQSGKAQVSRGAMYR